MKKLIISFLLVLSCLASFSQDLTGKSATFVGPVTFQKKVVAQDSLVNSRFSTLLEYKVAAFRPGGLLDTITIPIVVDISSLQFDGFEGSQDTSYTVGIGPGGYLVPLQLAVTAFRFQNDTVYSLGPIVFEGGAEARNDFIIGAYKSQEDTASVLMIGPGGKIIPTETATSVFYMRNDTLHVDSHVVFDQGFTNTQE